MAAAGAGAVIAAAAGTAPARAFSIAAGAGRVSATESLKSASEADFLVSCSSTSPSTMFNDIESISAILVVIYLLNILSDQYYKNCSTK
jgi:hypothetical protein